MDAGGSVVAIACGCSLEIRSAIVALGVSSWKIQLLRHGRKKYRTHAFRRNSTSDSSQICGYLLWYAMQSTKVNAWKQLNP